MVVLQLILMKTRLSALLLLLLFLPGCLPFSRTVTLALLGDLVLGRGVDPQADSLAYISIPLRAADLALANLESPLFPEAGQTIQGYNLCAPAANVRLLGEWGLDLLSLANNHRYDCAPDGPAKTRSALDSAGLTPLGPEMLPVFRRVNGLPMAFLALDDVSSAVDVNAAVQAVRLAHSNGAIVVVYIHWGLEYQSGPTSRQVFLAQQFAAAGASLVVGSHPHVLQPAAWINSSTGKTLVLYSLGNALFDQPGLPDTRRSALVLVKFDRQGIRSVKAVPFVIDVQASRLEAPDTLTAAQIHATIDLP
jgi:poly-gamma-glutamate capsule biosynthesis protein CapA/YwtB (metallophosphatase superfamily)